MIIMMWISGLGWIGAEIFAPTGIRSPDKPDRVAVNATLPRPTLQVAPFYTYIT